MREPISFRPVPTTSDELLSVQKYAILERNYAISYDSGGLDKTYFGIVNIQYSDCRFGGNIPNYWIVDLLVLGHKTQNEYNYNRHRVGELLKDFVITEPMLSDGVLRILARERKK